MSKTQPKAPSKTTPIIDPSEIELILLEYPIQELQEEEEEATASSSSHISNKIFKQQIKNLRSESVGAARVFFDQNLGEFIKKLSSKSSNLDLRSLSLPDISALLNTIKENTHTKLADKQHAISLILKQTLPKIILTPIFKNTTDALLNKSLPGGATRLFESSKGHQFKSRVEFLQHYLEYVGPEHAPSLLQEDCFVAFPGSLANKPFPAGPYDKIKYPLIDAKTNHATAILLHKIPQEDVSGLFATISPYLSNDDALRIVTTPVTKISSLAKNILKAVATSGIGNLIELAADKNRTLPKIVASNYATISPHLVQFLLEKNIPAKALHDVTMDHTFDTSVLHSPRRILTVLALNCVNDPENFTNLYKKIHTELTNKEKVELYLTDDFGVNFKGKFRQGASFASIAAEQYPEIFKQILVDLTTSMESGKMKPEASIFLDKFLHSSNKNLVTQDDIATEARQIEQTPLIQEASADIVAEVDIPQDDLLHHHYTAKNLNQLLQESQTAEAAKFKAAYEKMQQSISRKPVARADETAEAQPATSTTRPVARAAKSEKTSQICGLQ